VPGGRAALIGFGIERVQGGKKLAATGWRKDEPMQFTKMKTKAIGILILPLFLMLPSRPANAQADITGEWSPRVYNDGMDAGDYTGIPLNQAGRLRAESWHPDLPDLPENLCRPHPVDIGLRVSVSQLYITKELDKDTGQEVGYHLHVAWQAGEQIVYTDGRPHPSPNAPHKWSGFSTGRWEGNTLVYTTDHLKEAYLTRTGVPRSAFSTVTTRIHRYGNYLNITFIINDPAYLTEPYIREYSWVFTPDQVIPPYPCETSPEGTIIPSGKVPSYLPGQNDLLSDFPTEYGIPPEAALGGAEETSPDYIKKLRTMKVAPRTTTVHYKRAQ
jgi:hypothetical protein